MEDSSLSVSYVFLLFLIYSFIGWVSEVIYCSIIQKKLVNRGFLHGPICPIYGFGGLVVLALTPFSHNPLYLFALATILTTILEYVTSWVLESIFATKWWDYSDLRFNINGRVCLLNSLIFGAMSVVAIYVVNPAIFSVLDRVSGGTRDILSAIFGSVLLIDLAFTLRALIDLEAKLAELNQFMESVKESLDVREWFNELDLRGSLERLVARTKVESSERNRRFAETLESLVNRSREMTRLLRAFPTMQSRRHGRQLDLLRVLHRVGLGSIRGRSSPDLVASPCATVSTDAAVSSGAPATPGASLATPAPSATTGIAAASDEPSIAAATPHGAWEYLWVFFAASFVGVLLESSWALVTVGRFATVGGLAFGALNPAFGFGAVLITALCSRMDRKRDFFASLICALVGVALEFLISVVFEVAFGLESRPYSGTQLNLDGRANLQSAFLWGISGLLWLRYANPVLLGFVRRVPAWVGRAVALVLMAFALSGGVVTVGALARWSERASSGVSAPAAAPVIESAPAVESASAVTAPDTGPTADGAVERFLDRYFPDEALRARYPSVALPPR